MGSEGEWIMARLEHRRPDQMWGRGAIASAKQNKTNQLQYAEYDPMYVLNVYVHGSILEKIHTKHVGLVSSEGWCDRNFPFHLRISCIVWTFLNDRSWVRRSPGQWGYFDFV